MRDKLEEIITDYKTYDTDRLERMSEDDTRSKFIDRILKEVLGWDEKLLDRQKSIETKDKIKRADYAYPAAVPKIIVEAKKLKASIEDDDYDQQVLDYAYSKAVNWAVLTNFKFFKVWYVTRDEEDRFCNLDILNGNMEHNVEKLYWLSKDNLLTSELDDEAKRTGIKLQEIKITEDLAASLNSLREKVNAYIKTEYKSKYSNDTEREELTQGIINRLIFIKKVEAEGLEENKLEQIIRNLETDIYDGLKEIFAYYRNKYDSDIFGKPHEESDAETIKIKDKTTAELLETVSHPQNSKREYNFAAMDSDVLGNIYENYLAYMQKGNKLIGGKNKRKAQGIYYTPKNVVEYIVKNTVGEKLKSAKGKGAEKIKIVDPACGSGSFLLEALALLDDYYMKNYKGYPEFSVKERLEIVKNNLFGVDLDERAIAIAELNLYLKLLVKKGQSSIKAPVDLLPELKSNLKVGNSLIADSAAGLDHPFVWESEFKQIFSDGKFDIVIGNPPYGAELTPIQKKYFAEKYKLNKGRLDTALLFIEKSLGLLKNEGFLGFIVPIRWLAGSYAKRLREYLLANTWIRSIVYFPSYVFSDSKIDTIIIIFQKTKPNGKTTVSYVNESTISERKFDQKDWCGDDFEINIFLDSKIKEVIGKVEKHAVPLESLCQTSFLGIQAYEHSSDRERLGEFVSDHQIAGFKPELSGEHINRYVTNWHDDLFLKYSPQLYSAQPEENFHREKIVVRRILKNKIIAALDKEGFLTSDMVYNLIPRPSVNIFYLLGVLNSRLLSFYYYKKTYDLSVTFPKLRVAAFQKLPIIDHTKYGDDIAKLTKTIVELSGEVISLDKRDPARKRLLDDQISKKEDEVNTLVYKTYGITEEEKKIIEEI